MDVDHKLFQHPTLIKCSTVKLRPPLLFVNVGVLLYCVQWHWAIQIYGCDSVIVACCVCELQHSCRAHLPTINQWILLLWTTPGLNGFDPVSTQKWSHRRNDASTITIFFIFYTWEGVQEISWTKHLLLLLALAAGPRYAASEGFDELNKLLKTSKNLSASARTTKWSNPWTPWSKIWNNCFFFIRVFPDLFFASHCKNNIAI